jgi:septum formation protein
MTAPALILASASAIRKTLLANAGLTFAVEPAGIDERATLAALQAAAPGVPVAKLSVALAVAKAQEVSRRYPGALVIGADQMLDFENELLDKAADAAAARAMLLRLRGKSHHLHSGVALVRDGQYLWQHVQSAELRVRPFSDVWLAGYIAKAGNALTHSVGAYQLEGLGAQLFERVDGDYFTVLGLPLVALLGELRKQGVLQE